MATPNVPSPFEHQLVTTDFMVDNTHVFCQSDPGTGKTRSVLDAIAKLDVWCLVLAPKAILEPAWVDDAKKFTPHLRAVPSYAGKREQAFKDGSDLVVTNHDAVKWLVKNLHLLPKNKPKMLVIDESSAFKHRTSARSKAAAKLVDHFDRVILLNGTPIGGNVSDIWHQMYLLDKGERLGKNFFGFRAATCEPLPTGPGGMYQSWVEKPGARDAVADLIKDMTIRYKMEDCLSIPENFITEVEFELTPKHRAYYEQMKRDALLEVEGKDVPAVHAAVLANKLLQIASGGVYDQDHLTHTLGTERYELVAQLVLEREHCVVAFNWGHQRDALKGLFDKLGITYGVIDGTVSTKKRIETVDAFQNGTLRVVLAHPQSAAHGLTLTRGTTTIWTSPTYDAERYLQFGRRIYRAGQTKRTETIHIAAKDTIDERVYDKLLGKVSNIHDLLGMTTKEVPA